MPVRVVSNIDDKRPEKMRRAIDAALETAGIHLANIASDLAPRDTSRLKGSITWATMSGGNIPRPPAKITDSVDKPIRPNVVHVGTNVEYAAQVEYGGQIRAVNAMALTVPISPSAKGKLARDFPEAFIVKLKKGGAIIARKKGKHGIEALFSLRKSVTQRAQPYLRRAFDENRAEIRQLFMETISRMVVNG